MVVSLRGRRPRWPRDLLEIELWGCMKWGIGLSVQMVGGAFRERSPVDHHDEEEDTIVLFLLYANSLEVTCPIFAYPTLISFPCLLGTSEFMLAVMSEFPLPAD